MTRDLVLCAGCDFLCQQHPHFSNEWLVMLSKMLFCGIIIMSKNRVILVNRIHLRQTGNQ